MGRLARHDALTGLPNRTLFLDRVEQAVARSRRHDATLAVLFLDLDGFKSRQRPVRPRRGRRAAQDGRRAAGQLRPGGRLGRPARRRRVRRAARGGRGRPPRTSRCSASGCSTPCAREIVIAGPRGGRRGQHRRRDRVGPEDDAAGLLRNADMAMYRAKALGKDRVLRLPAVAARGEHPAAGAHRGAAPRHRRPSSSCTTSRSSTSVDGRIDGIEALVRWQRAGRAGAARTRSSPPPRRAV